MKTENKIFADFCKCLDYARSDMGVSPDWTVLARGSQVMMNVDKTILVDKISETQKGFQNQRFEVQEDGRLHEIWEWVEEYVFQVSCVRERRIGDTTDTVTADDVAANLKAWFNSHDGADYMRSNGIAPLLVKAIVPQQYTSENDMYQRYVHFDVTIQAVQDVDRTPPALDAIELGIKHVPYCSGEESGEPVYDRLWPDGSV